MIHFLQVNYDFLRKFGEKFGDTVGEGLAKEWPILSKKIILLGQYHKIIYEGLHQESEAECKNHINSYKDKVLMLSFSNQGKFFSAACISIFV